MKRNFYLKTGFALLVLAGFAVLVVPSCFLAPPVYESNTKLLVRLAHPPPAEWSIEADLQELQSEAMLSHVITNLNLTARWHERLKNGELQTSTTYALLRSQLSIRQVNKSYIIEITARSDDAIEAAAIANAVAQLALTQLRGPKNDLGTIRWSLIQSATPSPRTRDPQRFEKTILPLGGLLLGLAGVLLLSCGLSKSN